MGRSLSSSSSRERKRRRSRERRRVSPLREGRRKYSERRSRSRSRHHSRSRRRSRSRRHSKSPSRSRSRDRNYRNSRDSRDKRWNDRKRNRSHSREERERKEKLEKQLDSIPANEMVENSQDLEKRRERIQLWQSQRLENEKSKTMHSVFEKEEETEKKQVFDETEENQDIDPLDAYMKGIEEEARMAEMTGAKGGLGMKNATFEEDEIEESRADIEGFGVEPDIFLLAHHGTKRKDLQNVDHSKMKYEPFRKDFYIETQEIEKMTEEECRLYRLELDNIKIRGLECPKPIKKWTQCGLNLKILEVIERCKYVKPTPIQAQAIPAIMNGRDVIGVAKTGSGKTIAFLLPMFRHILDQRPLLNMEGPIAVILTPTRELCLQIGAECKKFCKPFGLRTVCAYGGSAIKDQIADLKRGAEIIVCTPGRLIDLLCANSGRVTNLKRVTYLVLDEADRMFDLGFEPQVMKIIANVRPDRQTVLFSATFPKQMEALARKILQKPLEIIVGGRSVVCNDVNQIVEVIEEDDKYSKLLEILGQWYERKADRILIFVDKQEASDILFRDLLKSGYPCTSLHGGKDQFDRDNIIADFKEGLISILIATSVAARGLDIKDLNLVINYECPNHLEDYVHRVGRTGRAGNKGTAYTFITPEQEKFAPEIVRALKDAKAVIPEELAKMAAAFMEKVKVGDAFMPSSGYKGKGLDRMDEDREAMKKVQKQAYATENDNPEQEEEAEKDPITGEVKAKVKTERGVHASLKAAQEAAAKVVASIGIPLASESSPEVSSKMLQVPSSEADGATYPYTTSEGTKAFCCEIEINDAPQQARFKMTSRDVIGPIAEMTGTGITVRGSFYANGRPNPGDRKLYVRIEGGTEISVERAKMEFRRQLADHIAEAASRGQMERTGRYSVI